jgi:hypothetical protein
MITFKRDFMEIVKLKDKSSDIQLTVKEALQEAMDSDFEAKQAFILLIDKNETTESMQGGGMSHGVVVWHLVKHIISMFTDNLEYE